MKDLEVVGVDRNVQAAPAHAQSVLEGKSGGGLGEGADGLIRRG